MLRPAQVEFLILGAGWTSTFLLPLLSSLSISHAAITTTGRDNTIPFIFDPASADEAPYKRLPSAHTILITFPLLGQGPSWTLLSLYRTVHGAANRFIQLGSSGIFDAPHWNDDLSRYKEDPRAIAEDQLLIAGGCVLDLAGLYGGTRDPKDWVARVASTKEQIRAKKALHMIHGEDVARAVVAVHQKERFPDGERYIVADLHVYDWWDLIQDWGQEAKERAKAQIGEEAAAKLEYGRWVGECMVEEGVRSLPRGPETLGRVLDSRRFWKEMGVWPRMGRVK